MLLNSTGAVASQSMGIISLVSAYVAASVAILKFYFTMVFRFGEIHPDLPSGKLCDAILAHPAKQAAPLHVPLSASFAAEFNSLYNDLKKFLRRRLGAVGATEVPFKHILTASFVVRAVWAVAAVSAVVVASGREDQPQQLQPHDNNNQLSVFGRLALLCVGCLQFVVAPLSLAVCVMRLGTNIWDCLVHYGFNVLAAGWSDGWLVGGLVGWFVGWLVVLVDWVGGWQLALFGSTTTIHCWGLRTSVERDFRGGVVCAGTQCWCCLLYTSPSPRDRG